MRNGYGLRRELATLKLQLATLGERAVPSWEAAAQQHAERVARRGWALMDALLDDGLPRPYVSVVALEAREDVAVWSPLTWRAWDICRWMAASEYGANACPWPATISAADCELLLTEPPGTVQFNQHPACVRCGYVVPCHPSRRQASVPEPWAWTATGIPCSACGAPCGWGDWGNVWWVAGDGCAWGWTPATGRVEPYHR